MNPGKKCANCGKPMQKEFEPFCSKRCSDVDLARWFRGDYAVPVMEEDEPLDDSDEPTQH